MPVLLHSLETKLSTSVSLTMLLKKGRTVESRTKLIWQTSTPTRLFLELPHPSRQSPSSPVQSSSSHGRTETTCSRSSSMILLPRFTTTVRSPHPVQSSSNLNHPEMILMSPQRNLGVHCHTRRPPGLPGGRTCLPRCSRS